MFFNKAKMVAPWKRGDFCHWLNVWRVTSTDPVPLHLDRRKFLENGRKELNSANSARRQRIVSKLIRYEILLKNLGIRRTWNKFNSFSTEFVGPLILSINWRINQTAGQMEKWPANPSHNEYLSRSTRWASARRITRIHQFPRDRLHWCDSQIALTADAISEEITKWNLSL